jgi:hypothetical protein
MIEDCDMPSLKTTGGIEFFFAAGAIAAVADHDDTGAPGTFVYGVGPVALNVAESPSAFLSRMGLGNALVVLTKPNNLTVWINPAAVGYVRAAGAGDPPAKAELVIGGRVQRILEDPATAVAKLNVACGGKF